MRFFSDRHGDQYPTSRIKSILLNQKRSSPSSPPVQVVVMEDGERLEVESWEVDRVVTAPTAIVPAQPGTYLLGGVDGDDQNVGAIWQTPVIAWAIGPDRTPTPYTADGADDGLSEPGWILLPNGMVTSAGNESHRSLEDWFQEQRGIKRRKAGDAELSTPNDPEPARPTNDSPPEVFERHAAWAERNPL